MLKRTTVYLEEKLHHAVKLKAVERHTSVSDLVSEALTFTLKEDLVDLKAVRDRAHEPSKSFESVLESMKKDGLL